MRRSIGVMLIAALTMSLLLPAVVRAMLLPPQVTTFDLRAQVLDQLFGEGSDAAASLAASYGDRASESPLRNLALHPPVAPADVALPFTSAGAPSAAIHVPFELAQKFNGHLRLASSFLAAPAVLAASLYRPGPPAEPVLPQADVHDARPPTGANAGLDVARPSLANTLAMPDATQATVPVALHVGSVQFEGRVEGASTETSQIALRDNAYGAGANFRVRAGQRNLNLDLSSSFEQLSRHDAATAGFDAASSWQLPGSDVPLMIPTYAQVNRVSLAAALAVPVTQRMTLHLNYEAQRLLGGYGLPGLTNLDTIGNSYGGKLAFAMPNFPGTLSISAGQYRYQDNVLPTNTLTQTRADVNFTVKF